MDKVGFILLVLWFLLPACTPEAKTGNRDEKPEEQSSATIRGTVLDNEGNRLEGVVVSDCYKCTITDKDGFFELESDLSVAKFVFVSIPSGYSVPVKNGLPIFFKRLSEEKQADGKYRLEFILNRMTRNPDRYSMLVVADPQPRARDQAGDRHAYHSLDVCEDLYRDMREKGAEIQRDRPCYGVFLGDIVHGDMDLFDTFISNGTSKMGFPNFCVLGNHDVYLKATSDEEGRGVFEEKLCPVNYSFNIGKVHHIVVDNIILTVEDRGILGGGGSAYGLTDDIWQWLKEDLSYVDKSCAVMIYSHQPMFMSESGNDCYIKARHGQHYASALSKFAEVHAWAGHIHHMFNYTYDSDRAMGNINVHTVVRSTGDFPTNEYIDNGTPRGYVVVDVDGDDISWRFRPLPYQTALHVKTPPEYKMRAWDYDEDGVARMKEDGRRLDEFYQMNVYPPGIYDDGCVYANVFMWDQKWGMPEYVSSDGTRTTMELVTDDGHSYDAGYKELFYYYYPSGDWSSDTCRRIFRARTDKKSDVGRVEVTDRFGNVYSTNVSW